MAWFSSYQVLHSSAIVASINVYARSRIHDAEEGKTLIEWEAEFMQAEIGTKYLFPGPTRPAILRGSEALALIYTFSRSVDEGDTKVSESSNCLKYLKCFRCLYNCLGELHYLVLSGGRALEFKFAIFDQHPNSSKFSYRDAAVDVLKTNFEELATAEAFERSKAGPKSMHILKSLGTPKADWQEIAKNKTVTHLNFNRHFKQPRNSLIIRISPNPELNPDFPDS